MRRKSDRRLTLRSFVKVDDLPPAAVVKSPEKNAEVQRGAISEPEIFSAYDL